MISTLNNNAENAVTPATPLILIRTCRPPIRATPLQDILDTREVVHNFFSEP